MLIPIVIAEAIKSAHPELVEGLQYSPLMVRQAHHERNIATLCLLVYGLCKAIWYNFVR